VTEYHRETERDKTKKWGNSEKYYIWKGAGNYISRVEGS
jgi:hypothetical protein